MTNPPTEWLHGVIGAHTVVDRPAMTARKAGTTQSVVQVRDAAGRSWFVKRPATRRAWRAEVHAYRAWVPALDGRAPTLHAAHEDLRIYVVSALPGLPPLHRDVAAVRQAGQLLRLLHDVDASHSAQFEGPRPMSQRLDKLLRRNADLFTAEEKTFARECAERATNLPSVALVPCHGDYNRHNWLVDETGTLRVIDFDEARWHRAAFDFTKLFYGPWWHDPHLAAAFFKGYGRRPDAAEMEFVRCRMALSSVTEVCFGRNRGHAKAEERGRSRLADLMLGHQVKVARRSPWASEPGGPLLRARRKRSSRRGTRRTPAARTDMQPVIREVWTLIHGDEWEHSPQRALDASRALYDAHRYLAVGGSFMAAFSAANELSLRFAGPRVKSALLADYPEEIFEPLGSRRRAETAIRDALDLLTGMAELADRPGDYSFEPRLQRLASDYKGTAVYVYSYCARRLYGEILDAADPDRRTERIEELRRVLTEATEPED